MRLYVFIKNESFRHCLTYSLFYLLSLQVEKPKRAYEDTNR